MSDTDDDDVPGLIRGSRAVAECIRQRMLFEARALVEEVLRFEENNATGSPSAYRARLVQALLLASLDERMAV